MDNEYNDLNEDDLSDHLNQLPDLDELIKASEEDLPDRGQVAIDQGVAYVRDIASKMCKNAEYGSEQWTETWATSTIVLFNMLQAMVPLIEGLNEDKIDALTLEFFLLGTRGKVEDLEALLSL